VIDALLGTLKSNLVLIGATLLFGTLAIWAYKDAREEDDYRDAAKKTGDRARRYTGGFFGILGVIAYGILGTIYQTGLSLADLLDMVADVVLMDPAMFAGFGVTLLAALGLEGVIPVGALGVTIAALVMFALAALARRRSTTGGQA
jgi:hypothetical protein